jgi:hypothetical protein
MRGALPFPSDPCLRVSRAIVGTVFDSGTRKNCSAHSRRQLLAKAAMAASRVAAYPCVGPRPSWCQKTSVYIQGEPIGARVCLEDAADNGTVRKHVEIIFVPLAGGPAGRCGSPSPSRQPLCATAVRAVLSGLPRLKGCVCLLITKTKTPPRALLKLGGDYRRTQRPVAAVPGVTHFAPSVGPLAQTKPASTSSSAQRTLSVPVTTRIAAAGPGSPFGPAGPAGPGGPAGP